MPRLRRAAAAASLVLSRQWRAQFGRIAATRPDGSCIQFRRQSGRHSRHQIVSVSPPSLALTSGGSHAGVDERICPPSEGGILLVAENRE